MSNQFKLADLIVELMSKGHSAVQSTLTGITKQMTGIDAAAKKGFPLALKGHTIVRDQLNQLNTGMRQLVAQVSSLAGINLSQVIALGSTAGLVAGIGLATKKFADLDTAAFNVQAKFNMVGLGSENAKKRLDDFIVSITKSTNVTREQARSMAVLAAQRGLNPGDFEEVTTAAIGLSEVLGVSNDQALQLVLSYQRVGAAALAIDPVVKAGLDRKYTEKQLNEVINSRISQGLQIARQRTETIQAGFTRMASAAQKLGESLSKAFGPTVIGWLDSITSGLQRMSTWIDKAVAGNKEIIASVLKWTPLVLVGVLGFTKIGGVLSLMLSPLGILTGGFGTIFRMTSAIIGLGNPLNWISWAVSGGKGLFTGFVALAGFLKNNFFSMMAGGVGIIANVTRGLILMAVNPLTPFKILIGLVNLLRGSVTKLLTATGLGAILVLLGAVITYLTQTEKGVGMITSLWEKLKEKMQPVIEKAKEIWTTIRVESQIVLEAVMNGWGQFVEFSSMIWEEVVGIWDNVVAWANENLGGMWETIQPYWENFVNTITNLWKNFTAYLANWGQVVKVVFLQLKYWLSQIPDVLNWVGDVFVSVGRYIFNNFPKFFENSVMLIIQYYKTMVTAVKELFGKLWEWIRGRGRFSEVFDLSKTKEEFQKLREQAENLVEDMNLPKYKISEFSKQIGDQLDAEAKKLEDAIRKSKSDQDDRRNQIRDEINAEKDEREKRKKDKADEDKKVTKPIEVKLATQKTPTLAAFEDLTGLFRRLQQRAGGETDIPRQQLQIQKQIASTLVDIKQGGQLAQQAGAGDARIVPR